jgi:NAD(P)-dependent dehydrogenase (short-subunit alcohol dehydrogenase family)
MLGLLRTHSTSATERSLCSDRHGSSGLRRSSVRGRTRGGLAHGLAHGLVDGGRVLSAKRRWQGRRRRAGVLLQQPTSPPTPPTTRAAPLLASLQASSPAASSSGSIRSESVSRVAAVDFASHTHSRHATTRLCGRRHGGAAVLFIADVRDLPALVGAVEVAVDRWGRLDAAVAAAGVIAGGAPMRQTCRPGRCRCGAHLGRSGRSVDGSTRPR